MLITKNKIVLASVAVIGLAVVGFTVVLGLVAKVADDLSTDNDISGMGGIAKFHLPKRWKFDGKQEGARSYSYLWETRAQPVAMFTVAWNTNFNTWYAKEIRTVLDQPAHVLSPSELSLNSVGRLVYDGHASDEFELLQAQTSEVDGVNILKVERKFKEARLGQEDSVIVDVDGNGKAFQRICYWGSRESYPKYHQDAEDAFRSLRLDLSYKNPASNPGTASDTSTGQ
ncbi:MAG: hypothetical protein U0105_24600 [Candidatus Obscuribacterales bacterium]